MIIKEEIILEIIRGRQGQRMRPEFSAHRNQEIQLVAGTIPLISDNDGIQPGDLAPDSLLTTVMQ